MKQDSMTRTMMAKMMRLEFVRQENRPEDIFLLIGKVLVLGEDDDGIAESLLVMTKRDFVVFLSMTEEH